jgi:hypothetical protein
VSQVDVFGLFSVSARLTFPLSTLNVHVNEKRESERRRPTWIALIPFAIALPGVALASVFWLLSPLEPELNTLAFGIVGTILAFDLPVCLLVLVQWIWTGNPPELSLVPLVPTKEERELRKSLQKRTKLDGDEFYQRFYANTSIPKLLVVKLRALLETQLGLPKNSVQPEDNMITADPELDWQYLIDEINNEFVIVIGYEAINTLDGTFDNLLKCIAKTCLNQNETPKLPDGKALDRNR